MKKLLTILLIFFGVTTANAQCNHTFRMIDSYGDGWNGSTVDVNVNGVAVLTAQAPVNGQPPEDVTFTASTGDLIELANWVTGTWTSEVSWEILDGAGTTIASGVHGDTQVGSGACPACLPPSSLATANLTSTSVDFSWVAGGTETSWNVEYGPAGFAQGSGTVVVATATTYSLSGLTANTAYDMYVQADCGSDQSSYVGPVSVTTPCNAVSAPLVESFDAGVLPSCWSETQATGSGWVFTGTPGFAAAGAGDNTGNGGSFAWIDFSGSDAGAVLTSPLIDVSSLTTPQLKFFYYSVNANSTAINILYTEAYDGANWSVIDSVAQLNAGWQEHLIDYSSHVFNTSFAQFRLRAESGGASTDYHNDILVDDIEVRETPSCASPTALSVSNVTDVSADLSWTAGGTETAWNIEYGAAGFAQGSGTIVAVTATTYSFSGLTPNTSYDMYVQSDCGSSGTSAWVGPVSATTNPAAGTCGYFTVELIDTWGDGWNGNYLEIVVNGVVFDSLTIVNGAGPESTLVPVDIGDVVDANYLGLGSYQGENVYNIYDHAGIVIAAEAGSAAGPPGSVLGLTACPSCTAPNTLTATNITTSSADLGWVAGGSETAWNIEYGVSGFSQGSGTVVAVSSNPYSLTGLTAATAYDYYIQSDCGGGDTSIYVGPYTFGTLCNVDVAPYFEDFDNGLSVCWTLAGGPQFDWTLNSGGTLSGSTGPSDDVTGGGNYMYIETSSPRAPGDSAFLISSSIDISGLTLPELRFFSHMYGASIGELSIHVVTAANPAPTMIWQKLGDQGDQWDERTVDLSAYAGGTVQFIILGVVGDNGAGTQYWGDAAIDNFQVRETPSDDLAIIAAVAPSGCALTNAEPIEVWVENQGLDTASNFDVSYGVNGGTAVVETFTGQLAPGDTLMHVFAATADMSADGVYDVALHVDLATDSDTTDNHYATSGENYFTPAAATTMGDTICDGDTAHVHAMSNDGYVTWYDAMTGGNEVGEGDDLMVAPNATTSYYAEVEDGFTYSQDFDGFADGDLISVVDSNWWTPWPAATVTPAAVTSSEGNGGNSLKCDYSVVNDPVFEYGEAISRGTVHFSVDMKIINGAYFNMQEDVAIGTAWAFDVVFDNPNATVDVSINGASVLSGTYSGGTDPMGAPKWITVELDGDYNTGLWELTINGSSIGSFANSDPVASANFYPRGAPDNDLYYLDNIEFLALKGCVSENRTEAIVVVNNCTGINEIANSNLSIFPNPNKGEFTISNSSEIINVNITDVQGKVVYTSNNVNLNKVDVNVSDLDKGMYMIFVETVDVVITEQVIIK